MKEICDRHGEYESKEEVILGTKFAIGCPVCIREKEENETAIKAEMESEEKQSAYINEIVKAGIPKRFWDCTFGGYKTENHGQENALDISKEYYEKICAGTDAALIFCGECGTGKNHLAISILLNLIRRKISTGIYTKVGKMIRDIRSSYARRDGPSEQEIIDKYIDTPLLILNEVGVQYGTDSEKILLFDVIDGRYEAMKPIILIGNISYQDMVNYLGKRIIDRLNTADSRVVIFDWESYRGRM